MSKKQCVAMLLAGGQGSRLMPLTRRTAKPSVPFGSKYRIIDFPLSNCQNSGIDTVGVLTQYRPQVLSDYLGQGAPWDMDLKVGGLHLLSPYEKETGGDWFSGTANAIYQNIDFIKEYNAEYVLILSGDHIYKMNYNIMLQEHIANEADCTIAVFEVPMEEASRFGIMNTSPKDGRILEFEEKPKNPKSNTASMGVYIFSTQVLLQYLEQDAADETSDHDFGKNIIPNMLKDELRLFAYLYKGYWRDVGTLDSYWAANMDVIGMDPSEKEQLVLDDPAWEVYYRHLLTHPQYIGPNAEIHSSVVSDGCDINGTVVHSVLFGEVVVEEGAVIRDSVVLGGARIKKGAFIEHAIIDEGAVIGENARIGEGSSITNALGAGNAAGTLSVVAEHVEVPANTVIAPGTIVEEMGEEA